MSPGLTEVPTSRTEPAGVHRRGTGNGWPPQAAAVVSWEREQNAEQCAEQCAEQNAESRTPRAEHRKRNAESGTRKGTGAQVARAGARSAVGECGYSGRFSRVMNL
nr:hypothetical protein KitaXyl93_45700 [Kitasatospora sp. Xyl93]